MEVLPDDALDLIAAKLGLRDAFKMSMALGKERLRAFLAGVQEKAVRWRRSRLDVAPGALYYAVLPDMKAAFSPLSPRYVTRWVRITRGPSEQGLRVVFGERLSTPAASKVPEPATKGIESVRLVIVDPADCRTLVSAFTPSGAGSVTYRIFDHDVWGADFIVEGNAQYVRQAEHEAIMARLSAWGP